VIGALALAVTLAAASSFDAAEQARLRAAAANEPAGVAALARFYGEHGLCAEALAALRRLSEPPAASKRLGAECAYRMGRYADAAKRAQGVAELATIRAMALTSLGAYAEAAKDFRLMKSPPGADVSADYWIARAEAMALSGDVPGAGEALTALGGKQLQGSEAARRAFAIGALHRLKDDRARMTAAFTRAARLDAGEYSLRARLALLGAKDVSVLQALSLQHRGGAFEREIRFAIGEAELAAGRLGPAFASLARVVDRFPQSDDALKAQEKLAAALGDVFEEKAALAPADAAQLFFRYVEFAPPGREGDKLIQAAAARLDALGLYAQAAKLLDHQVFKRLRGAERSIIAADLAALHLKAQAPAEALRVLRSTRIAGLPTETASLRRRLEADALARAGEAREALSLLADAPSLADMRLRADINWSAGAWVEAARDYASLFGAAPATLSADDRNAAVRAATGFLLAGDRAAYRAFAKEAALRLEGTPEAGLIGALGDVDQDEFLARFMRSYRSVYGSSGS
jgi:hypothetical protein